jgi:hypothetical protein
VSDATVDQTHAVTQIIVPMSVLLRRDSTHGGEVDRTAEVASRVGKPRSKESPSKFLVELTSQIGRVTKESGKRQADFRIFAIARIL